MKRLLTILLACALMFSMVACTASGDNQPTGEATKPTESQTQTNPTDTPTEPSIAPSGEYDNMSKVEMAAYILDKAASDEANTMYSPLSLNMALGLVAEGANQTYSDLFEALLDEEDYPAFAKQYMEYLDKLNADHSEDKYDKYKTVFEIANSLWVDTKYQLTDAYLLATEPFAAEIDILSLTDKTTAVNKINSWCAEKTRDMIKKVLAEEDLNADAATVAVNAVYFESPWLVEWYKLSAKETFTRTDGTTEQFDAIKTTTVRYYENNKATAFGCDYRNGLTFIGILPKEEGEFAVSDLDIDSLLNSQTNKYDVRATMPTLKFNNKIQISDILKEIGCYTALFSADGIFDQMVTQDGEQSFLTISKIIQCDAIELDEKGTKAAAVTAITMDNTAAIPNPKEYKEIKLDRPFAFVIYDSEMDQIVFIGKVVTAQQ